MQKIKILMLAGVLAMLAVFATGMEQGPGYTSGAMNDVPFMTGGVGMNERVRMEMAAEDYNLKIALTTASGAYLAQIPLTIRNDNGEVAFETRTTGPWLYVNLPEGRYTVAAEYDGTTRERKLQLGVGTEKIILQWPR